jgi:membrane fusion protein (multidrug efflux system)
MFKVQTLILAVLLFLQVSGCSDKNKLANPQKQGAKLSVEAYIVKSGPVDNVIVVPGTIFPNEQIQVRSELSGRIEELNFTEGTFVKKGTILVKVDDSELKAQLQKLEAQISQAKADESRKKQLIEVNGITQEEYDLSVTKIKEYEADIALIKSRIYKSSIRAPFDGFVGLRFASPGAYVSSGDIISTLVETNPVKVEFNVPEKYVGGIKDKMEVKFSLSGNPREFKGIVYAFDPMIDASSRTLKVRALGNNSGNDLVPGAFVEVSLEMDKITDALMIPTLALVPLMNGQNVYLVKNGRAKLQEVNTGIRNEKMIQVIKGVDELDTVVVTGLLAIRNGVPLIVSKITQ